uniref:Uncharacterized protein n=1 Tax=uncultured haloarchaeon TaxID=160804 RepID=A0A0K1YB17_9EURY|nr:hypothetical protein [uncultured haloarchaeon]
MAVSTANRDEIQDGSTGVEEISGDLNHDEQ